MDASAGLNATFGGVSIMVPLSTLVIDPYNNGSCILSIANYGPSPPGALFGNSFLRNTYTVFDPANHQIAMAQAKPAPQTRNIVAISDANIPFVTQ